MSTQSSAPADQSPLAGFVLPEAMTLPQSFLDNHFGTGEMLRMLNISEAELWTGIIAGRIPPPATLPDLATSSFAFAEDANQKYVFVRMLGACLREILGRQGVRFSKDRWHYFFRSTPDFAEKKVGGLSVFKGYQSKTTPDRIAYYRHRAAELDFIRFDGQWFLQITPTYHFTQDGWKLSRYFDERLSGIKQLERQNKTHLRQLRMWEEVLRQTHLSAPQKLPKQRSLFEVEPAATPPPDPYTLLSFDPLVAFDVDWNVPESAWLPQPTDDNDSEDTQGQGRLFE